ncbi:MAG: NTP transferase domain-containing protein [bacterium]|nr:NTP transferase domain-containing protein [bacterium]
MQTLILAAGAGTRFGGSIPKPLIRIAGKPLISRLCEQMRQLGCDDLAVVCGFQRLLVERILNPNIRVVFNPFYQVSDTLTSFWFAQSLLLDDLLLVQADFIADPALLQRLVDDSADLIFAYDPKFLHDDEIRVELVEGIVRNVGESIPPQRAAGVVLPVQKISRKALSRLKSIADQTMQTGDFQRDIESAYLEMIMAGTFSVAALDVSAAKWCEINEQEDLDRARMIFGE